jgi:hypothetical protein
MHTVPASEQWMWAPLSADSTVIHIWPAYDVVIHTAEEGCVCVPRVEPMKFHGDIVGTYVIHRHHYLMN